MLKISRVAVQDLANRLKVEQERLGGQREIDESAIECGIVTFAPVTRACDLETPGS